MREQINYVKLGMAVAAGVVVGTFITWIISAGVGVAVVSAAVSDFNAAVSQYSSDNAQRIEHQTVIKGRPRKKLDQSQRQRELEIQRKRANTSRGKQLWNVCEEWSENYKRTPIQTIRLNGKFHCDRYDRYIKTGQVTTAKAPILETR